MSVRAGALGKLLVPALVLAALAIPSSAAARPTVLLIHGGGFIAGSPSEMAYAKPIVRAQGFRPVLVRYTLGDLPQDFRQVARIARRSKVDYAIGESAGGTFAAWLAAKGLVRAAGANAPISDLAKWAPNGEDSTSLWPNLGADRLFIRRHSPALIPNPNPVLVFQNCHDPIVDCRVNKAYAKRFPRVGYRNIGSGHLDPRVQPSVIRQSLRFFENVPGR